MFKSFLSLISANLAMCLTFLGWDVLLKLMVMIIPFRGEGLKVDPKNENEDSGRKLYLDTIIFPQRTSNYFWIPVFCSIRSHLPSFLSELNLANTHHSDHFLAQGFPSAHSDSGKTWSFPGLWIMTFCDCRCLDPMYCEMIFVEWSYFMLLLTQARMTPPTSSVGQMLTCFRKLWVDTNLITSPHLPGAVELPYTWAIWGPDPWPSWNIHGV